MSLPKFYYRADIDGLRAVAVLAVLFFHLGLGFEGGYVGVDVFFVISGYLITSLIRRDLAAGKFSLKDFWVRRARRILPAMVATIALTLLAAWFVLFPDDFKKLGDATMAQALFSANIYYWRQAGYFGGESLEKPLLHMWSLAVEEQFYLVMPLAMMLLYYWRASVRWIFTAMVFVAVISLGVSIWGVANNPTATFYLLPTRAWELLLGAMVALLPALPAVTASVKRELLSGVGLLMVLLPVFLYDESTPFPGYAALPPCVGSGLLIWANILSHHEGKSTFTYVGRFLAWRPMVGIGLISYSLYLAHWPLVSMVNYANPDGLTLVDRLAMVVISFVLAILMWRWVETPFRLRQVAGTPKSILVFASTSVAMVFICGVVLNMNDGFKNRISETVNRYASASKDETFRNELEIEQVKAGELVDIGVADKNIPASVFVWGDSFAMAAMPAVDQYLKNHGLRGYAATKSATVPVLNWHQIKRASFGQETIAYNQAVFEKINQLGIKQVILVSYWSAYDEGSSELSLAMADTMAQLREQGCETWFLLDAPNHSFDVPRTLSRFEMINRDADTLCSTPATHKNRFSAGEIETFKIAGAHVMDPRPVFLDPTGTFYQVIRDDVVLYRDHSHLSTKGALKVLLPFLEGQFDFAPAKLTEVGTTQESDATSHVMDAASVSLVSEMR